MQSQEAEIERRRRAKEAEEELSAAAVLQESIQDNGALETEQQPVAVQTKPLPERTPTDEETEYLQNGIAMEELAEIRMVMAGTIIPHVNKVFLPNHLQNF